MQKISKYPTGIKKTGLFLAAILFTTALSAQTSKKEKEYIIPPHWEAKSTEKTLSMDVDAGPDSTSSKFKPIMENVAKDKVKYSTQRLLWSRVFGKKQKLASR